MTSNREKLGLLAGGSIVGVCAALVAVRLMSAQRAASEEQKKEAVPEPPFSHKELQSPVLTSHIAKSPLPKLSPREVLPSEYAPSSTEGKLIEMENGSILRSLQTATNTGVIVVGVAGGTGSGKTTLAKAIRQTCDVAYISHDSYYKDLSHLSLSERDGQNFDHPDALDTDLLYEDLLKIKHGEDVNIPMYDFGTHTRTKKTELVRAQKIILVEGILIFTHEQLRGLIDVKIYVDTADDVRFIRRLTRDLKERGRSTESVIKQYMRTVRPMHLKFVEPSKVHADVIVPVGLNQAVLDMVIARLRFAAHE